MTPEIDDVGDEPLLSFAEAKALAAAMEAGLLAWEARSSGGVPGATTAELICLEKLGEQARQRFIRANLGLVGMVAGAAATRANLPPADLFQEGCLGLILAVERFDHRRELRFSTYALFWIRAYVKAAATRQLGAIDLPSKRAEQLRGARSLETELSQELGRTASVAEVAQALGRSTNWTGELLGHQQPQSLDALDTETLNRIAQVDELEAVLDAQFEPAQLLDQLDSLSRRVLELQLGLTGAEPQSMVATARTLGISVTCARRTAARALETLRDICPQQVSVHL